MKLLFGMRLLATKSLRMASGNPSSVLRTDSCFDEPYCPLMTAFLKLAYDILRRLPRVSALQRSSRLCGFLPVDSRLSPLRRKKDVMRLVCSANELSGEIKKRHMKYRAS